MTEEFKKTVELYQRAIELNDHEAMNNLASIYKEGQGVKQDYNKAIELYQRAISLNNSGAMNNLAWMYHYGEGVERDYNKAIEFFQRAVDLNNFSAMNNLASIYYYGEGVKKDYKKAVELYKRSFCIRSTDHTIFIKILELYIKINRSDLAFCYIRELMTSNTSLFSRDNILECINYFFSKNISFFKEFMMEFIDIQNKVKKLETENIELK